MTFQNALTDLNACAAARAWVGDKTLAEAWDTCDHATWMLWLCRHARVPAPYERIALEIARTFQHLDPSGTAQQTLDVVERYLAGAATGKELDEARAAAWAAEEAAARSAAWATEAAAWAAAARSAAWAARAAWVAAARSAAWATEAAARADPALDKQHADTVRRYITADAVAEALREQGHQP